MASLLVVVIGFNDEHSNQRANEIAAKFRATRGGLSDAIGQFD